MHLENFPYLTFGSAPSAPTFIMGIRRRRASAKMPPTRHGFRSSLHRSVINKRVNSIDAVIPYRSRGRLFAKFVCTSVVTPHDYLRIDSPLISCVPPRTHRYPVPVPVKVKFNVTTLPVSFFLRRLNHASHFYAWTRSWFVVRYFRADFAKCQLSFLFLSLTWVIMVIISIFCNV